MGDFGYLFLGTSMSQTDFFPVPSFATNSKEQKAIPSMACRDLFFRRTEIDA